MGACTVLTYSAGEPRVGTENPSCYPLRPKNLCIQALWGEDARQSQVFARHDQLRYPASTTGCGSQARGDMVCSSSRRSAGQPWIIPAWLRTLSLLGGFEIVTTLGEQIAQKCSAFQHGLCFVASGATCAGDQLVHLLKDLLG